MHNDTTVTFSNPAFRDILGEVVRNGAQRIIRRALEVELQVFVEEHEAERDARGCRAVVCDGYLPAREVLTGIGPVTVRVSSTRDRCGSGIKFNSRLLPPYLRRTKQTMELLPWLYLKGVSTGTTSRSIKSQVYWANCSSVKGYCMRPPFRIRGVAPRGSSPA